jgi:FAD/FMN-containing dehydrogenase
MPRQGVMPTVVPQLKTITLGGAVAGVGIESSSHRHGLVHDGMLELDVLLGDGAWSPARRRTSIAISSSASRIPTARSATRCACGRKPIPVKTFVHLRHVPFHLLRELQKVLDAKSEDFRRRHRVRPGRCSSRSGASSIGAVHQRLTSSRRSTTARSQSATRTTSPSPTTSGAGTPTGSGARRTSSRRTRSSQILYGRERLGSGRTQRSCAGTAASA